METEEEKTKKIGIMKEGKGQNVAKAIRRKKEQKK